MTDQEIINTLQQAAKQTDSIAMQMILDMAAGRLEALTKGEK